MHTFLFEEKKINFDKITAFLDFEILQFLAKTQWKVCIIIFLFNLNLCRDLSADFFFFFTKLWPSQI